MENYYRQSDRTSQSASGVVSRSVNHTLTQTITSQALSHIHTYVSTSQADAGNIIFFSILFILTFTFQNCF